MNSSNFKPCHILSTVDIKLQYFMLCMSGISFIVSLLGNLLVVFVTLQKKLVTPFSIATIHLALCDFLTSTRCITDMRETINNQLWYGNEASCKFAYSYTSIAFLSSVQTMTFIALERRNKVVTPLSKPWSYMHIGISIAAAWIFSISMYSPYIAWLNIGHCGSCTFLNVISKQSSQIYITILFLIKFVIPLCIMGYCYYTIIVTLYHRPVLRINGDKSSIAPRTSLHTRETKRVVKMLIFTLIAFAIMTLPAPMYYLIRTYSDIDLGEMSIELIETFSVLHYLHSGINPIIYFSLNRTFRRDSIATIRRLLYGTCNQVTPSNILHHSPTSYELHSKIEQQKSELYNIGYYTHRNNINKDSIALSYA